MPVVQGKPSRKQRVAASSSFFGIAGVVLWLVVWFFEPESESGLNLVLTASQLWWVFIGVAAVGVIVHAALPEN